MRERVKDRRVEECRGEGRGKEEKAKDQKQLIH